MYFFVKIYNLSFIFQNHILYIYIDTHTFEYILFGTNDYIFTS